MAYLSGPAHALTDFQVEYAGLLMGAGTAYDLPPDWELLGMAAVKTMDTQRMWADGDFSGPDFADKLHSKVKIDIYAPSAALFASAVLALMQVATVQSVDRPLWFKLPGMAVMGVGARVNTRSIPISLTWDQLSSAVVEFRIPTPIWQSIPRTVSLVASGSVVSGLVFPMFNVASGTYVVPGVADFGSTVVASAGAVLTNAGSAPAWPVVTVPGPSAGFTVAVDGNRVSYGAVAATDSLVIDYASGSATLDGVADRSFQLTSRQFTPIPPGGFSNVLFNAAAGSAQVQVADMWR